MSKFLTTPIKNWSRSEWLQFRGKFIGGSDIGAIMGLSKYKSPLQVFLEKIEEGPDQEIDNMYTRAGKWHEYTIRKLSQYWDFEDPDLMKMWWNHDNRQVQQKVRTFPFIIQHKRHPFLGGNIDGMFLGTPGILECKTTSSMEASKYTQRISPTYYLQLQHYLLITGKPYGVIGLLIDGVEFDYIRFDADQEVHEAIIEKGIDFWSKVNRAKAIKEKHDIPQYFGVHPTLLTEKQRAGQDMLKELEPDLTGEDHELAYVRKMIKPTPDYTEIEGSHEQLTMMTEYRRLNQEIKFMNKAKNQITEIMIGSLGGIHKVTFDDVDEGYFSYKPDSRGNMRLYVSPTPKANEQIRTE